MTRIAMILLCALIVLACGPGAAGGGATPEMATVVVMGQRANTDDDTVERYPACMGVAVSPTAVLTAAHCMPTGADGTFAIVDHATWNRTSAGVALADLAFDAGELRTLVPRQPLLNWATPGSATDGPAEVVVLRGRDFTTLRTTLDGDHLTGALDNTDSGAGVFQGGYLVGIVQTCTTDILADDPDACIGGGRFAPVIPDVASAKQAASTDCIRPIWKHTLTNIIITNVDGGLPWQWYPGYDPMSWWAKVPGTDLPQTNIGTCFWRTRSYFDTSGKCSVRMVFKCQNQVEYTVHVQSTQRDWGKAWAQIVAKEDAGFRMAYADFNATGG